MAKKILIPQDIAQVGKDYLTERGYELLVGTGTSEEEMIACIGDCDGIIVRLAKVTAKVLHAGKRLKVVGRHGVGTDNIDLKTATELGIQVTNGPESNCEEVAEHIMMLTLALLHRFREYDELIRTGNWNQRTKIVADCAGGRTFGIVGFGRIGRSLARRMHNGLNMKILVLNAHIHETVPDYVELVDSLDELASRVDVLSLNCPATAETKNMVNREFLANMKPTAFLVNAGRGELVDEDALYEALMAGTLKGAALDVMSKEPMPVGHPLLSLKNVVMTPHCASHVREGLDKMALHAAMGVDEVLSGKPVTWPVNRV